MDSNPLLQGFADNEAMMVAVRDLLMKQFSVDSLTVTDSDILLGQLVRARLVGLKAIEDAFKEIAQHRSVQVGVDKRNPGR